MEMSPRTEQKLKDIEAGKDIECEICKKMVPALEAGWGNESDGHAGLCSDCTSMAKVGIENEIARLVAV